MGPKTQQVGGGPAAPLADDFVNFLRQGITTGSFGGASAGQQFNAADPISSAMGFANSLNFLLSGGLPEDQVTAPMTEIMSRQADKDVGALRSRFDAGGGVAFGTPAAYAESVMRSETGPKMAAAVGDVKMRIQQQRAQQMLQTLQILFPAITGLAGKGIPQAENVVSPSPFSQGLQIFSSIIGPLSQAYAMKKQFGGNGGMDGGFDPSLPPDTSGITPGGQYERGGQYGGGFGGYQTYNPWWQNRTDLLTR